MPTNQQFTKLVAKRIDANPTTIAKYLDAIVETICYELYFGNAVSVDHLGTFKTKHIEASKQYQQQGETVVEYQVPEHDLPKFEPCDDFINSCNMCGVTKQYRKRLKNNALTKRDLELIYKKQEADIKKQIMADIRRKETIAAKEAKQKEKERLKEEKKKGRIVVSQDDIDDMNTSFADRLKQGKDKKDIKDNE